LVRAWLEGDWSVIDGAFFDCWSSEQHVLAPFTVPADWLRFRSFDWGSAKPFSVGWWAVPSDDYVLDGGKTLPRGSLVRYREWYGCVPGQPNTGLKLHAEEIAAGIVARSGDEKFAYTVLDPSTFAQDGGPSHAERMMKAGLSGLRPGDNKRISQKGAMGGWDQMRARLKGDAEGRPMIYTFSTCTDSIRTIPSLQHDADRPEDLDSDGEDHAADEWRYGCMSRPYVPVVVAPKLPPKELTYEVKDGQLVSNMSVMEIVQERMRRKKANGY